MRKTLPRLCLSVPALFLACTPPDATEPAFELPVSRPVFGPVAEATVPPPPISGGTLLLTRTGYAVASDPDRDTIHIVNVRGSVSRETATVALEARDEPGRGVEDQNGRVHVLLRRGGAVVTLDPSRGEVLQRRAVCAAPRGIALDGTNLLVVCAGGEFLRLPVGDGAAQRVAKLEPDLRDVVVSAGEVYVSTFRSARVLQVTREGTVRYAFRPRSFREEAEEGQVGREFAPAVAWRMIPTTQGVAVLHQRASTAVVDVSQPDVHAPTPQPTPRRSSGYGPPSGAGFEGPTRCPTGIVQSTMSTLPAASGSAPMPLPGTFLVDLAQHGDTFAVVGPGSAHHVSTMRSPTQQLLVLQNGALEPTSSGLGCVQPQHVPLEPFDAELTAVAFDPRSGELWVQSREPARLIQVPLGGGNPRTTVVLRGASRRDSGHEVFHANAGGDIACASCHPEGGDDGRTWRFSFGARRTQNLRGGITGTEPLHWDGDMRDLGMISDEVFTRRMNGDPLQPDQVGALRRWIDAIPTVPHSPAEDPAAVARGREVFERADTACAGCHGGPHGTNNQSVDVGTGGRVQVPSLVGVAFRGPFMHTGCANTLADRFDPRCGGGDAHGRTSQLNPGELRDLVSYLQTL